MKVEFLLTIRMTPETKEEALGEIAPLYQDFRARVEAAVTAEAPIQIPHDAQIRWLLIARRFE